MKNVNLKPEYMDTLYRHSSTAESYLSFAANITVRKSRHKVAHSEQLRKNNNCCFGSLWLCPFLVSRAGLILIAPLPGHCLPFIFWTQLMYAFDFRISNDQDFSRCD